MLLSIRDDGVGGADPARGSGLVGLTDRVEALGGSIHVRSRAGDGTYITTELPPSWRPGGILSNPSLNPSPRLLTAAATSRGAGGDSGCLGREQLADLAGDDEADLFADVDRLVAEALRNRARKHQLGGPAEALSGR